MPAAAQPPVTWDALLEAIARLRKSWPTRGWSWDSRLLCVASSFSVEVEQAARAAAGGVFVAHFTSQNVASAPRPLKEVVDGAGGLRAGQIVFASSADGVGPLAYGLWWPWGDGTTTSLRIGLAGTDPSSSRLARLRDAFGVSL